MLNGLRSWRVSLVALAALGLTACGGGGGTEATGFLSASITDAAVDEVDKVNLRVVKLQLRLQDADEDDWVEVPLEVDGEALEFDLKEYQHGEVFPLFDEEEVPAGVYSHARLVLQAPARTPGECVGQDPLGGSHVVAGDALVPIFIPSGANTGVKLVSPFRVPENGLAQIVIDFDLRKSLFQPPAFKNSCYFLRPAFRVEAVQNTGRIVGTVDAPLLTGELCSDEDPATGNAVYVYEGSTDNPGDINADQESETAAPFATSVVKYESLAEAGHYVVDFLPPGEYTVAFTCRADEERLPNPDAEDEHERLAVDDLEFQQPRMATVVVISPTVVNFD